MKIMNAFIFATIVLTGLVLAVAATQPNTVTRVVVSAKQNKYSGPCPTTIEFVGTIFVSRPTRVEYRWERSDGVIGPREFVDIRSAGKGVTTTWRVGTPRRSFNGWERLRVLSPNGITSNTATIRIKCN